MADPVRRYVEAAKTARAIANHHARRALGSTFDAAFGLVRSAYQAVVGGPDVPGPGEDRQAR